MAAERCPVCNGSGKIQFDESSTVREATCHGCNGKGWVEVGSTVPYDPYSRWLYRSGPSFLVTLGYGSDPRYQQVTG